MDGWNRNFALYLLVVHYVALNRLSSWYDVMTASLLATDVWFLPSIKKTVMYDLKEKGIKKLLYNKALKLRDVPWCVNWLMSNMLTWLLKFFLIITLGAHILFFFSIYNSFLILNFCEAIGRDSIWIEDDWVTSNSEF